MSKAPEPPVLSHDQLTFVERARLADAPILPHANDLETLRRKVESQGQQIAELREHLDKLNSPK